MINSLIDKAKKKRLEVEDILGLVKNTQLEFTIDDLSKLKEEILYSYEKDVSILFNKWVKVVTIFFEHGYNGLVQLATNNNELASFAISVLEETKNSEGFDALIKIMSVSKLNDVDGYKNMRDSIASINLMISFDDKVLIIPEDAELARQMIHAFLKFNKEFFLNESDVTIGYCALRKIGDLETIKLIMDMPVLQKSENKGLDLVVINAIKKRLKDNK
jgi:hypothetical protein